MKYLTVWGTIREGKTETAFPSEWLEPCSCGCDFKGGSNLDRYTDFLQLNIPFVDRFIIGNLRIMDTKGTKRLNWRQNNIT